MSNNLKHGASKPVLEEKTIIVKSKNKKSKKPLVIALVCVGVAALAAAGVLFWMFMVKQADSPLDEQILDDLKKDESITIVKVGDDEYSFNIDSLKINKEKELENGMNYNVSIERSSDMYGIPSMNYNVEYTLDGNKYKYKSASPEKSSIVFTALKGIDPKEAKPKVTKTYHNAKFLNQETDLVKGVDKIRFTVDDDEYEGTAVVVYKFSDTEGWKYVKVSDDKVKFKKGVTHKEDGLYTNTNVKNILFMGVDSDSGVGRSDCMMLISVDSNTGKLKQTSFMRDNWFEIPGHGYNKLNAAYALGGPELTCKTISQTFGIKITKYVTVDFSTFKEVINELGGVNIKISDDEAGYINWQLRKNGQTGVGLVSGGNVTLNGQQALWLCRDRGGNGFGGDDFTRSQRQRRVIQSLLTTYSNYTPDKVLKTINVLKKHVKTNLSSKDFEWFAERSTRFFGFKVTERTVPQDGEWSQGTSSGGAWIEQLNDFPKLKKDVQKTIYEDLK
ncbi:MAG: LCP family protein [Ruminococcus sp.]|nr:LCP family protein [Ruminococcus sp.]